MICRRPATGLHPHICSPSRTSTVDCTTPKLAKSAVEEYYFPRRKSTWHFQHSCSEQVSDEDAVGAMLEHASCKETHGDDQTS